MIPEQPQVLLNPLGNAADKIEIPETTPIDTAIPSQQGLFPPITSVPLTAGGLPVERTGMNGLFALIGQFIYLYQSGLFPDYNAQVNYMLGSFAKHEGIIYFCIQNNGPDFGVTATPPNPAYWVVLDYTALNPVGTIIAYAGRTIPSGWLLCDGRQVSKETYPALWNVIGTLYGTSTATTFSLPKLTDNRYIRGAASNAGTYVAEGLPAITHNHGASSNNTGAHTHARGTMDIGGTFKANLSFGWYAPTGAFSGAKTKQTIGHTSSVHGDVYTCTFKAANNWTGVTSSNGGHSHTITVNNNSGVSAIYGKSSNVTPLSLAMMYLIKF